MRVASNSQFNYIYLTSVIPSAIVCCSYYGHRAPPKLARTTSADSMQIEVTKSFASVASIGDASVHVRVSLVNTVL